MVLTRKRRVRVHLVEPHPGVNLPSIEGLLVSRRHHEYLVALPELLVHPGADNTQLESRLLAVPRDRVAFYEVL